MTDWEKVIGLLSEIAEYFHECQGNASVEAEDRFLELQHAATEASELLKAQEPVKPIRLENWWKCPSCSGNIVANMNYCPRCGRAVKWDD